MEIDGCIKSINSDIVKKELGSVPQCITLHPGFHSACLDTWSLRMAGPKFRKMDRKKDGSSPWNFNVNTTLIMYEEMQNLASDYKLLSNLDGIHFRNHLSLVINKTCLISPVYQNIPI